MDKKQGPLYLKVKERIREEFGGLGAHGGEGALASLSLPTLEELQERLQVSRPTIGKALAALAAEGFLVKQAGRGTFALAPSAVALGGSRANGAATPTIGYIAPLYAAELPQRALVGIDRVAHRCGYRVVMAGSGDSVSRERGAAHEMIASGARGLIIYPTVRQGDQVESDYLRGDSDAKGGAVELPLPVVLIDTAYPGQGHTQVVFDNRRAGYQVTSWLIQQGHSRIGLVFYTESAHHPAVDSRLRGYEKALADNHMPIHPEFMARIEPFGLGAQLISTLDNLLALPRETRPTAIIATDDLMAIEIINTLSNRGVRVPQEIAVTGFDNLTAARHFQPEFTTTDPDFEALGEVACEMLIEEIEASSDEGASPSSPKTYILPVSLLIREGSPSFVPFEKQRISGAAASAAT